MPQTKTKPTTHARRQLEDFPALMAARSKLDELFTRRRNLQKIIELKVAELGNRSIYQANLDAEVQQLLAGNEAPRTAESDAIRTDLNDLEHRMLVVGRAITQQERAVKEAHAGAAREIRADAMLEHQQIGRGIRAALVELRKQLTSELAFRDGLVAEGADFGGPLMPLAWPRAGTPDDLCFFIDEWLKDAKDYLK